MAGEWTLRARLRTARGGLASTVAGGVIYAIGGFTSAFDSVLSSVEAYDPVADRLSAAADMRTPRGNAAAATLDGLVYALGGFHRPGNGTDRAEVFDPATGRWTEIARLPTRLTGMGAAGFAGRIFTAGGGAVGHGPRRTVGSVYVFDPKTDSWTSDAAPMPTARELVKMGELDGRLYVVGGVAADGRFLATVERYDPATDGWDLVTPMTTARGNPGVVAAGGRLVVVGGAAGSATAPVVLGSSEAYDPRTDTWQPLTALLPVARGSLSGAGGPAQTIFAIGGFVPPGPSASDRIDALTLGG
jgi:N-acetylneuraminic acid mutarotase